MNNFKGKIKWKRYFELRMRRFYSQILMAYISENYPRSLPLTMHSSLLKNNIEI